MPKTLSTHSEEFHTDDVFATALLLELFPDARVVRTRDEAVIASGDIVYDVGKIYDPKQNRFDHHQAEARKRDNGITYSAFGLLWQEYGEQFCDGDAAVARRIDQKLVTPIDANDNGQEISSPLFETVRPFTVDDVIGMLNPLQWAHNDETHDEQFTKAVDLARRLLHRLRDAARNSLLEQRYILDSYANAQNKHILVLEKRASVSEIVGQCPELLYLVSPRPNGTWGVLAVASQPGSFACRKPFPEAWRGKSPEELVQATGIADILFCHATGFLAVTQSRAGAELLANKALHA